MPRGGRRTGTPGRAYGNRSDLNSPVPVQAATGQQYGAAKAQMDAQRAVPIARPATDNVPTARPAAGPPALPMPPPGMLTPLDAPTTRPNEPLTAGMALGAGAGPEANPFANIGSPDDAALALRAAYAAYPSEELRAILERLDLDG